MKVYLNYDNNEIILLDKLSGNEVQKLILAFPEFSFLPHPSLSADTLPDLWPNELPLGSLDSDAPELHPGYEAWKRDIA
jgi:hypothetical protein